MTAPSEHALAHCRDCAHRYGSGCGCGCCAWAGVAVEAAREVIARAYSAALPGIADIVARESFQAALPVVRAAAAAAERERIIALAGQRGAMYPRPPAAATTGNTAITWQDDGTLPQMLPFADLLRAGPADDTERRGKRIIMARCEWHEECNGPICQVCDNCVCEGGCTCPDGATYGRQAAEALGYIAPAQVADLLRAGPGLAHTTGDGQ